MTWSLLVHDPASGALACAVATCNLAVGASVPFIRAGVGAVATQSITNRYLGPTVLEGMARGLSPQLAVAAAVTADEGRMLRQLHAIDTAGRSAAHTGDRCVEWCGHLPDAGLSVAGNMLSGPDVIAATRDAFLAHAALLLPERMLAAMHAGEAAGGDRRGRQSAAIRLVTTEDFPDLDLRVDDHAAPLEELSRLLALWRTTQAPRLHERPRRADPAGLVDLDILEARFAAAGLPVKPR
jgi:uncharacterized Ntn-hydrolase superfamily protein